jgi:hypothetical protein
VLQRSPGNGSDRRPRRSLVLAAGLILTAAVCLTLTSGEPRPLRASEASIARGKAIFRHDTFGDEQFWTDKLKCTRSSSRPSTR